MAAITTYESHYPSGLMTPNIKAERRGSSSVVIRASRDHNIHDVEIRRIEEVIGIVTPTTPGSGTLIERVSSIEDASGVASHNLVGTPHIGNADGLAITADPVGNTTVGGHTADATIHLPIVDISNIPVGTGSANHDFARWFLGDNFMGVMTDWFAGDPNTLEMIKTIWQNKYDLEVLFDPLFLFPCDADGIATYFTHELDADTTVWCGFTGQFPAKPIGAVCNLETRPWAIMPGIHVPGSSDTTFRRSRPSPHLGQHGTAG